ncbi:aerotolerance-like protein [Bacteroidia bacterium]|nr:aerotolerance-like protein [Bacteroidia bacterium]
MRKLIFLFTLVLTVGLTGHAADVVFKASAPNAVAVGQQFQLYFTVNAEGKDLRVQEMPDFDVLFGPAVSQSHSITFVNGQNTSETNVTFTYTLMAKKEGTFTISPATIKVNNANYASNALSINVLPADKAADAGQENAGGSDVSSTDVFVTMQVSKRSVYEQEGFLVTFKLYSKDGQVSLSDVKFPEFEGFLAQEIDLPDKQWGLENYNGSNYRSVVLKQTVLYPQRSGKLTIEAGKINAVVRIRIQQKARSIFDNFFDSYQNVNKQLTTTPVTIDVKPLPSGKPATYSNAVGDFSMTASISSSNIKANEAVTVKVNISGNGNIRVAKNPEVTFPNDFDVYDPKVDNNFRTTASGVSGSKTIEYMAIPRYAGDFEIPAIQFSFFDIKSGTYKTLSAGPYTLHVEKGEGGSDSNIPVVSNFSNRENVQYLGQDIRYLKVKGVEFITKSDIFFGSFLYYLCYLVPAVLFIIFFIIYRKKVKENANIALVRTKKANKMAVRRLKNAGKLMQENKREAFYDEVLRALWGYLSDKLNIPQSELTKDNVETELVRYGVGETLIHKFMDILNTCEFARYAPLQESNAMDKLYDSTVKAIGDMENTIKK